MVKSKNTKVSGNDIIHDVLPVAGMYENWFLDYASYVILERAVPAIEDGLKPVQRRILHAMKEIDDGRFNKVANIIGNTMQFHPHGDASISDAIIALGQKNLLIETQGNWGDIRTGDSAAAPRYIEARLSKFAHEVVFNPDTTKWQLSYDGRKREPITLPVKFPLLLAQGVEGIAVGLSTRILPHNFIELIDASIDILKGNNVSLVPDFPTGGLADFSEYNEGQRGGRVRIRAQIEEIDKKTLAIRTIPFGTTTTALIESIVKASDKGNIKIKKVVDNTAKDVEIEVQLAPGQSPNLAIDALYAFTECEVSISPNACVIIGDKPSFTSVNEILKINTDQTVELLKEELEIKKSELLEKILFSSLEKIFIENRIYRDIEECETWESVIETIDEGLKPFKKQFYREITGEDIVRLTEIKIKRISRFDTFKADELLKKLQDELTEVKYNLKHLIDYAIRYFLGLKEKYGKGRERMTEIRNFDTISAAVVAANNQKLYVNREDGFIGYGLKKDEYISECSDLDDIIVFRKDGKFIVTRIAEKVFVGKDILHASVFSKKDERMVYNLVYLDGKSGKSMVKRFQVLGITRDKEYDLTMGNSDSRTLYLTANPNGEAETVTINLNASCSARKKVFDFDFSSLEIKGRSARGNILTRYPVRKIQMKSEGISTLGGLDVWYDNSIGKLNRDKRGFLLGNFLPEDSLLLILDDGSYQIIKFDINLRLDPEKTILIEKFNQNDVVSAVYIDGDLKTYFVKRFQIETSTIGKKFSFISENKGSKLALATIKKGTRIEVDYEVKRKDAKSNDTFELDTLIDVKGWKAQGNKLGTHKIINVKFLTEGNVQNAGDIHPGRVLPEKIEESIATTAVPVKTPEQSKKKITAKVNVKPSDIAKDQKRRNKKTDVKEKTGGPKKNLKKKSVKKIKKGKVEAYEIGTTISLEIKKKSSAKEQLDLFEK